ncbi:MAG: caspase family protein [Aliidongia sp.]
MSRRLAILIGNQAFAEASGFAPLRGPHNDVDALARVLGDPARGAFELLPPLKDAGRLEILGVIRKTLSEASAEDTVRIH